MATIVVFPDRLESIILNYCNILFYSGILPCYCNYSHASLAIVLKLCSFHVYITLASASPDSSFLLPLQMVRIRAETNIWIHRISVSTFTIWILK